MTSELEITSVVESIRGASFSRDEKTSKTVSKILDKVKNEGDRALISFEREFGSKRISKVRDLGVSRREFREAYSKVKPEEIEAMKTAYKQIQWLAIQQMKRFSRVKLVSPLGFEINERYVPFRRVGGYIPGGLASYPSTVLMVCALANVVGVRELVLATPSRQVDGKVNEALLVAAYICGVKKIIKAGGAQAIAALAYGTKSINKVDLIVGPGNAYVTEAKRQVSSSGDVVIDGLAGPTELLILADDKSSPKFIVEDLISQAEHGNRTLCGIVSDSENLLNYVEERLSKISSRKRIDQIREAKMFTVKVRSKKLAFRFAQAFAPEHLESMVSSREVETITNSGLILLGDYTPCSSTDYIVGTNHILPTKGTASKFAGLGVENFLKRVTLVKGGKKSLRRSSKYISSLALLEGFPNHASAAISRIDKRGEI